MRSLSPGVYPAISGQHSSAAALWLLTITHPTLSVPIRFVNNMVNVVSRGETFLACAFSPRLPDDIEDRLPELDIEIDNVDRRIVEAVQTLPSIGPTSQFKAEIVWSTALDTPEISFTLKLRRASWDALTVKASLSGNDELAEAFPGKSFTPAGFPGLYLETVTTVRTPTPAPSWPSATPPITIPVPVTSPQYNPFSFGNAGPPAVVPPGAPVIVTPLLVSAFIDGNAGILNATSTHGATWHTANNGTVSFPPFSDVPSDGGFWWILEYPPDWVFLDLGTPTDPNPAPLYGNPPPTGGPPLPPKFRQASQKVAVGTWYENGRLPGSRVIGDVVNRWWFVTPPPGPMGNAPV